VGEREKQYIVDIFKKECECRRWQLAGIPCQHAISCLRHERIPPESVVYECYSVDTFNRAYEPIIFPCKDMATWEKVNGPQVVPPVYEKKVGRPRKSRRKQPYEVKGTHGTKMSRHGVIIRCGYCKGENHNAKGCSLKKKGLRPHDIVPDVPPVAEEESFHNDNVDVPPYDVQLPEEIPMTANASQPAMFTQGSQQDSSQPAMLLS